jgi:hypothetical protein
VIPCTQIDRRCCRQQTKAGVLPITALQLREYSLRFLQ